MLAKTLFRSMSRTGAATRTQAIVQHMMSTAAPTQTEDPSVVFESNLAVRTYILNRPKKLNALDETMLGILRPKIEEWSASELCGTIVGTGTGRAFCAGGDVASVIQNASDPSTRNQAIDFFKREFEMDYILATLQKPYVAILDGHTMGGGVGLAAHAPFRVATENTVFAMPETKIGYCPDVGASYFLSRMDGELGTYLALTSDTLRGRAVFEHGFATHFIPSRRIPMLLDRLASLEKPHAALIDRTIEELSSEREADELPLPFAARKRMALDFVFRHNHVAKIFEDLKTFTSDEDISIRTWASDTLKNLRLRSPTSLKVALQAIRKGKNMTLLEALDMELKIATAYCNGASHDFATGVKAVLIEKTSKRPQWSPASIDEVSDEIVSRFFASTSSYISSAPMLTIPEHLLGPTTSKPMKFALPTEEDIGSVVRGSHSSGGATGLQLHELLAKFNDLRQGKMGVKEKVLEVANRRCETVDNADGNFVWLKWKHAPTRP